MEDIPIEEIDFDTFEASKDAKFIGEDDKVENIDLFYAVENMPEIIGGYAALQKNVFFRDCGKSRNRR